MAESIPLSLLNDFLYCPRRAALKFVEGWREANEHTILGDIVHEHADLAGYEVAKGVLVWRALPVWSERLGLSGKCDIVEVELGTARASRAAEGAPPSAPESAGAAKVFGEAPNTTREARVLPAIKKLVPVEYKKGNRRQFDNDDAQLCAQALCLEEMFGVVVDSGAVFHAASKRRREVEFTAELRKLTEDAIHELHGMLDSALRASHSALPPAVYKPACEECSLFDICLPKVTSPSDRLAHAVKSLYEV